jgi:adenylate cyclase
VTTIGRNAGNDIVIDDPVVSRIHANVSRQEGGYALRDLNSSAGTHVLGRGRVSNAVLKHDDRIRIGDTELVFEQEEADLAIVPAVRALRSRVGATIVSLRSDEGAFDESAIAFKVPVPEHAATGQLTGRRASMLTRVATALQWVTDLDDVLVTLLDVVFELFQPDRGVILLKEPDSGNLVPRVSRPQGQELVISHTIIQYALEHRISVMVRQTAGDERFKHAQSIMAQSIRAAICCPLRQRSQMHAWWMVRHEPSA